MIILEGKNLGERQHQLNSIVNDAAKHNLDFNVAKEQEEKSDVDKLFKIDLAAKYKNVDYIVEIFKYGDPLYITRAVNKCSWLYDNQYLHIINVDYLSANVFPTMAMKMRNLLLIAIATHLKSDDKRAIEFCAYCMKIKLYNIALKFLIHTPKSFKLEVIMKKCKVFELITDKEGDYLEHFIGNSFELAENYLKHIDYPGQKCKAINLLRYMYTLSNEKYLDMLEVCDASVFTLGRRISKRIILNHKQRVMKKPYLYVNTLNKDILKRHIKIEEAKIFAVALLPDRCATFFYSNYYSKNKFILDVIPAEEKYTFVKKIFSEKYKDEPFETSYSFYSSNLHEMMTCDERESWALQNIASQNEILGNGNDYMWYKYINFNKAFNELKKEIMKTTDFSKRCDILMVLLESAKNEEDLTKIFNYYSDRHRNETPNVHNRFLNKLLRDYKVWQFGESCWKALEKIFYIIEVFDKSKYQSCDSSYRSLALVYYILNEKPVPEVLNEYLEMNVIPVYILKNYTAKSKPDTEKLYQYILQYYADKVKSLTSTPCEGDTKKEMRLYLSCILDLAKNFNKTKDDLPEIVLAQIKLDWCHFEFHQLLAGQNLSATDIMHYLKKDATLVVTQFPQIQSYCESLRENINWLIRKLKIYFSHDITEKYVSLFNECLSTEPNYITCEIAVRGIIILAGWSDKIEFLEKYTPKDKIMDKAKTSTKTAYIQRAICRQMHCSRPPLPLEKVFQYITGDYVQYCIVVFRSFLANLPQPQGLEFVQKLINSPVSIQKHGLRLAFECFEADKLQVIILDSWKKTKNVSLRTVLYKQLSTTITEASEDAQQKLFDVLISLTLDLTRDDDESLKLMYTMKLPDNLLGRYLEAVWNTVSKFDETPQNFQHMARVIQRIENNLCFVPEDCVDKIVNDHIHSMLDKQQIIIHKSKYKHGYDILLDSKWDLAISSIAYTVNGSKLENNVKLAKHIIKKCIEMWDALDDNETYVVRLFFKRFILDLITKSCYCEEKMYHNFLTLIQVVEKDIKKDLPSHEIYQLVWYIQSSIIFKTVILELKLCGETLKPNNVKEFGLKLGADFGMAVKKHVEEGTFYRMFCEEIKVIAASLADDCLRYFRRPDLFSVSDVLILFCLGLLQHEIFETYMLALIMLPVEYEDKYLDTYLSAIKKIRAFQNKELQFYFYSKFVYTDFKKRDYI